MTAKAHLYNAKNIDELDWPSTIEGSYAKKMLYPLVQNGISHYIDNIHADVYVLKVEDHVLPVVVTTENYTNSWVCSPYAHYISYGLESIGLIDNLLLSTFVKNLMKGLGRISRSSKMNSIAYVNNWMFSTDLYPQGIQREHIQAIVEQLTKFFPHHAIMIRSLNDITTPDLMQVVTQKGFRLMASRYVFITDGKNESIFKTRILKSDLKLLKENPYQIVDENELKPDECDKLLELYHQLYVIQHSRLQPQFNLQYFKLLYEQRLLRFKILKEKEVIKGIAGYYKRDQVMMCPIFGYEKNNPESNVIYRLLNTSLLIEAQKEGLLFNQSAGAAFFKSIRRASGCLEYNALYINHLPLYRKVFWSTLKFFMNTLGAKYMQKY